MKPNQISAGLWVFAQSVEKYGSYTRSLTVKEQLQAAASVPGIKGVELIAPTHVSLENAKEVKGMLDDLGLTAVAVNPLVWTEPDWHRGAFTSPDPAIRQKAIDVAKRAVDIGHILGSRKMCLWPGEDGWDYPFQADFSRLWDLETEAVRQIAEHDPETKIGIEYKLSEPRTHILVSTAAKAALLGRELGLANVGGYLDFGHALIARESPAESVELLARHKRLIGVHVNDNYGVADDDIMVGSVHFWAMLEFLMALDKVGYDGWVSLDIVPRKENAVEASTRSVIALQKILRLIGKVDLPALRQAQTELNAIETQRIIQDILG